jgi:hypothetical protein
MPKRTPDRDDSRGGLGSGGPQDGPIGGGDGHQRRDIEAGGIHGGVEGQGGQRHENGSSRDTDRRH